MATSRMNEARPQGASRGTAGPVIEELFRFTSNLATRRVSGAEQLQSLAESTRGLADNFEDLPMLREQVQTVADNMDEWAEYIRDTDVREIMTDARRFVYQHPYATFAVAIVGGVAAGGYIRAKAREEERRQRRRASVRSTGTGRRAVERHQQETGSARADGP